MKTSFPSLTGAAPVTVAPFLQEVNDPPRFICEAVLHGIPQASSRANRLLSLWATPEEFTAGTDCQ